MTDDLGRLLGRDVSRETSNLVNCYVSLLQAEATKQNLVSAATLDTLWKRHIVDSAQLARFAPTAGSSWVDIGSGAGLPGMVIALLTRGPVLLVEPRRLRADFLQGVVDELRLGDRVTVERAKAQDIGGKFDVITARAVAALPQLLTLSTHLSTKNSLWVLPKGRSAQSELEEAKRQWHCDAKVVPSVTDADARILLLRNVRPRGKA